MKVVRRKKNRDIGLSFEKVSTYIYSVPGRSDIGNQYVEQCLPSLVCAFFR